MSRFVLITRHLSECGELQGMLTPSGITLRPYPVLRLEGAEDDLGWGTAVDRVTNGDRPVWVVVASPRAPERFVRQCRSRRADDLLALPIAAIGEGTESATVAAGLQPTIVGPGTGAGLAELLIRRLTEPTTVVFACGRHRRPELPEALTEAGHEVVPVVVYHMQPTPKRELPPLEPGLDAVVVTSPRAASLYLEGVGGRPLPCPHWALGPTTRDAAGAMGIQCSIPPEPNLRSLAEELCRI
jgi:uroporphyrinogen-III synthase